MYFGSSDDAHLKTVGVQVGDVVRITLPPLVIADERDMIPMEFHNEPSLGIVQKIWVVKKSIFLKIRRLRYSHGPTDATFGCFLLELESADMSIIVPIAAITGFVLASHRCLWDPTSTHHCSLVPGVKTSGDNTFIVQHHVGNTEYVLNRFRS